MTDTSAQTPFQAPKSRWAAGVVIIFWLMIALGMGYYSWNFIANNPT